MENKKGLLKKRLSTLTLFILAAVSYLLAYLIGGAIGDFIKILGFILLVLTIIELFRERGRDKNKQNDEN